MLQMTWMTYDLSDQAHVMWYGGVQKFETTMNTNIKFYLYDFLYFERSLHLFD